ncbi:hypothetical protein [Octadecabacter antarcticus]|uniref:hypothetical protein n=1 Tax=Octadecabacter antarcticus TaxID=1217908 RepID=UPI0005C49782|nr:hypothetical protein [Octadecabacter antarcticus]
MSAADMTQRNFMIPSLAPCIRAAKPFNNGLDFERGFDGVNRSSQRSCQKGGFLEEADFFAGRSMRPAILVYNRSKFQKVVQS